MHGVKRRCEEGCQSALPFSPARAFWSHRLFIHAVCSQPWFYIGVYAGLSGVAACLILVRRCAERMGCAWRRGRGRA